MTTSNTSLQAADLFFARVRFTQELRPGPESYYSLPYATAGSSYAVSTIVPAGTQQTTFAGTLPAGIVMDSAGNFSGIAASPGQYRFTLGLRYGDGTSGSLRLLLVVNPAGCIVETQIPAPLPMVAGTGLAQVTAASECFWDAQTQDDWLTVNPAVGFGSAAISVISMSNSGNVRTGTLRVAGQSYSVLQAGSGAGPGTGLRFVAVPPCRIADTRNPVGPFGGPTLSGGASRDFRVTASGCLIPAAAQAYSLNVTVVPKSSLGFLTIWPAGRQMPLASTLNAPDGRAKAAAAIVQAGTQGAVSVYTTGATELILDISGYFVPVTDDTAALAFYPVRPCRIADTRFGVGEFGAPALQGGIKRTFSIPAASCGVPASARAYSLNFTVVPSGPLGFLATWPSGQPQPRVSTLNAITGAVTANAAIVAAGTSGAIEVYATNPTHLVLDINGYFGPDSSNGLSLYASTPCRVLDSRNPPGAPPWTGQRAIAAVASGCSLPQSAQEFVANITVLPFGPLGFVTVWPDGTERPLVSTLNSIDGSVMSNMAIIQTLNGSVDAYTSSAAHLIFDVSGYFAP